MKNNKQVLILASGSGSNAEAIVEYFTKHQFLPIDFSIGCNRAPERAGVYKRMEKYNLNVNFLSSPGQDFSKLSHFLELHSFDLIVLAGYMRILPDRIVDNYNIINIHPSLLPFKYKGSEDAYKDAIDNGDTITGCTVHRVTVDVDGGPRLAQIAFEIPKNIIKNKNVETLKQVGLSFEHALYPAVIGNQLFNLPITTDRVALLAKHLLKSRGLPDAKPVFPTVFSEYPIIKNINQIKPRSR